MALFGVLSAVVLGALPSARPGDATTASPPPAAGGQGASPASQGPSAIDLLRRYTGAPAGEPALPAGTAVSMLIATLPDPVESRLDWTFDQHLDALRRAHEKAGFVLDRLWLPWHVGASAAPETHEPGLLLFRDHGGRQLRLLFLVGEVPTRGVHKDALASALAQHDAVRRLLSDAEQQQPCVLRVVGPVFSGSSRSLRIALDRWLAGAPRGHTVDVVTGAATDAGNEATLTEGSGNRIRFAATIHSDSTLLDCLMQVMARLGLERHEVAILKESSTEYGANADVGDDRAGPGFLTLPVPMNISSLRSAYARTWTEGTVQQGRKSLFELDLEARDSAGEMPPAMSKMSPAVIDLLLAELAHTLEHQRIRMVVLFATDVRDKIFLGREIAKRLPDIQLVTTESNLLYVRSELAEAQRGMLVLSTYPLFAAPVDWIPQSLAQPDESTAFASDGAEGVYNAALRQLGRSESVVDYGPPFESAGAGPTRPPVWLTCVGKTQMLPVTCYAVDAPAADYPVAIERFARSRGNSPHERPDLAAVVMISLLALAILIAARSHRGGRDASLVAEVAQQASGDVVSDIAAMHRITNAQHRELYSAIGMVALTSVLLPNAAILWKCGDSRVVWDPLILLQLGVLAVLVVGVAGSISFIRRALAIARRYWKRAMEFTYGAPVRSPEAWRWRFEVLTRAIVALLATAYGIGMVAYSVAILRLGDSDFEFLFHRVTPLAQCVTPLLPIALIGVSMAAWSQWHLRRVALLGRSLPYEAGDPPRPRPAGEHRPSDVRFSLIHAVPDRAGYVLAAVLLALAVTLWVMMTPTLENLVGPDGEGQRCFDHVFFPGLIGLMFTTAWAAYRLFVVWRRLCRGLRDDSLRLGAACSRLVEAHGVLTVLGLGRPPHEPDLKPVVAATNQKLRAATEPVVGEHAKVLAGLAADFAKGSLSDAAARARIVEQLRACVPLLEQSDDEAEAPPDAAASATRAWLGAAYDSLAVELVEWVRWAMSHLRTLACFLLTSLLLATALIWAYPFHPQSLLRITFLVLCTASVAVLTFLVMELSRNPILSRLTKSTPGEATWDRTLVVNILTYSVVPLLALIASQIPDFGATLFAWL
ncbi:MAG TPA: hypothetical protein VFZ65_04460, partial [Planctomycetota bacterium]|nr:hypothetical protein [Planctomycetota bacterium]